MQKTPLLYLAKIKKHFFCLTPYLYKKSCLSVCQFVGPSVSRPVRRSISPSVQPSVNPFVRPSVRPSIGPSVRRSVRPSVTHFFSNSRNRLFPTLEMDTKWRGDTRMHTDTHTRSRAYIHTRAQRMIRTDYRKFSTRFSECQTLSENR